MQDASSSVRRQWCQLLSLTLAHAVADTYVGIVAPILAPLRDHYQLSISLLIFVASLLAFSSNVFQLPIGHLRSTWRSPVLICGGVLLAGCSVLLTAIPQGHGAVLWMSLVALVAGLGVAAVHPEGLRAVHGLDRIPSSLSTAVFMVAGFTGFAGGALVSSSMVEAWGLRSIVWLYAAAPLAAAPLYFSGIRLHVESDAHANAAPTAADRVPRVPFLPLFAMAATLATCSQIQATLLPTYLHETAHFSLSFSGLSFTLFGLGGMVGAITWGALAPRLGHLRVLFFCTLLGAPLTLVYLMLAPHTKWAAALLTFTAFVVYTGFPLCITLARFADSRLRLGQRMGIVSGGTWGIAAVALWILGPVAEHLTGMAPLLHLVWIGYLAAAALTYREMRRARA